MCLVIPARGRLHLDSAHRRPHAYLNIVKPIVAEPPSPAELKLMSQVLRPLRLTLPVVAAGFIGIHCLRSLVRKFFSRASRLRLCVLCQRVPNFVNRVSPRAYDTRVGGLPIFWIVREYTRTKIRAELPSNAVWSSPGWCERLIGMTVY